MRVFLEDGFRVGCFPKDSDGDEVLGLGDGRDESDGGPAFGAGHVSSTKAILLLATAPAAVATTSRHARFEGGSGSSCRHAPEKREEGSG